MGTVNADFRDPLNLLAAHVGSTVDYMDSTTYAAAVADKTRKALTEAGETVYSAALKSGIPHSTLDRKFNAGKGIQALNMRELHELAQVAGTSAADLATVYEVELKETA